MDYMIILISLYAVMLLYLSILIIYTFHTDIAYHKIENSEIRSIDVEYYESFQWREGRLSIPANISKNLEVGEIYDITYHRDCKNDLHLINMVKRSKKYWPMEFLLVEVPASTIKVIIFYYKSHFIK
jgi:hypothetical protein